MINVLYVISNLNPQGPINQLLYLCKHIDKNKIKPFVVTTSQTSFEWSLHSLFKDSGITVFDLKLNKLLSIFIATKRIQEIVSENQIHIIQSFGFRSDLISSNLKNVYKITTVRNTLLYNWKIIWGKLLGTLLGNLNLHYIKKFDSVISCSKSVHNYLKTLGLQSDIIVNSIDIEHISVKPNNKLIEEKRESLKIPIDKEVNITISSILKGKNIEFIINAFQTRDLLRTYLIVAGFVDSQLIIKYQDFKNIIFIGKVNNLKDYFQVADFFISASLHEGMPNAVLEAMSMGTPVLLSDIPSHIEILQTAKCSIGKSFINNNYEDFYKTYRIIKSEDYRTLSNNCTETIKNHYNAKQMANEYEEYYILKARNYKNKKQNIYF